ncbi:MAG TPA: hypothetical protein PKA64_04630 [Myxococcota bacterium]|nr:hypothetical protein [Myxococcota bacterium]
MDPSELADLQDVWIRLRPALPAAQPPGVDQAWPRPVKQLIVPAEVAILGRQTSLPPSTWFEPEASLRVSTGQTARDGVCGQECESGVASELFAHGYEHGGIGLSTMIWEMVNKWGIVPVQNLTDADPALSRLFCNLCVLELEFPSRAHPAFPQLSLLPGSRRAGPEGSAEASHAAHTLGLISADPERCTEWSGGLTPRVAWVAGCAPMIGASAPVAVPNVPMTDPSDLDALISALRRAIHGDTPPQASGPYPVDDGSPYDPTAAAGDPSLPVFDHGEPITDTSPWSGLGLGDVLLVEAQLEVDVRNPGTDSGSRVALLPIDVHPEVWSLVRQATDKGILVVLPAGNSGEDLDALPQLHLVDGGSLVNISQRGADSGALLVTYAGVCLRQEEGDDVISFRHFCEPQYPTSPGQPAEGVGGWGRRVDCFSWGNNVRTIADWLRSQADFQTKDSAIYTGTSSAAAIIACAAVVLQAGYRFATMNKVLSPGKLRALLADPLFRDPRIGSQPDLRRLFAEVVIPVREGLAGRKYTTSKGTKIDLGQPSSIGEIWSQATHASASIGVSAVLAALDDIGRGRVNKGLGTLYRTPAVPPRPPNQPPRGAGLDGRLGLPKPPGFTPELPDIQWEVQGTGGRDPRIEVQSPVVNISGPGGFNPPDR